MRVPVARERPEVRSPAVFSPTVTVAIPVLNEEAHLAACLAAIENQTYGSIVEVLVVDGGSSDATRAIAAGHAGVQVLDNPRRIQAAALNIALGAAVGEVFVRVDGHCTIAPDYVEHCVAALAGEGVAMVGGAMTPVASGRMEEAIATAMASRVGAGPARFHTSGTAAWVDTVYLGAYRTATARAAGGYAEDVGVNEDAEFAIRMAAHGGVWFDPAIRSTYTPRDSLASVGRQFYRYGRSRAATVRRHPASLSPRQLVAPALVVGLLSPWRRWVLVAYLSLIVGWAVAGVRDGRPPLAGAVLPAMHLPWGAGFFVGLALGPPTVRLPSDSPQGPVPGLGPGAAAGSGT
jgi:glycosyltransferase involved in cell wall biosynthesis